jgi:hypothetical protein
MQILRRKDATMGEKHIGYDLTIENAVGATRSDVGANGQKLETVMHNTYGYIRGAEGVDGDHMDVFLSDNVDGKWVP